MNNLSWVRPAERENRDPLYINAIKITDLEAVESILFGKPEFEITVSHFDPDDLVDTDGDPASVNYVTKECVLDATIYELYIDQDYMFDRDGHYEAIFNHRVAYWDNAFFKSVFNFQVAEHDDQWIGTVYKASLALMKAIKTNLSEDGQIINTAVDASIGVTQVMMDEWNMDKGDHQIGTELYPFWGEIDHTLHLGYGCKVKLGREPYLGNETWEDNWDL